MRIPPPLGKVYTDVAKSSYPISIVDLVNVQPNQSAAEAIAESIDLAQTAEAQGFHRIWYVEHHNMVSRAASATAVLLAHLGNHTTTIRIGAGGIMLPNHAPLVIAEQFGTLAEIFGPRIDLGLGRAPGTDQHTMRALRRDATAAESFPADVVELQSYLQGDSQIPGVAAHPGHETNVPLFILGSSHYGAQLAAQLGLGYSFASHFSPQMLESAARVYHDNFQPSAAYPEPYFIAAVNVVAADTTQQAQNLWEAAQRSQIQELLGGGRKLTDDQITALMHSPAGAQILELFQYTAVGTGETVRDYLDDFRESFNADELIISNMALDVADRGRTLELVGQYIINR